MTDSVRLRRLFREAHRRDEAGAVSRILDEAALPIEVVERVAGRARRLIQAMRERPKSGLGLDSFLQEYGLSTREGVALMCLAEALLRIPDTHTADLLIRDKIAGGHWEDHLGQAGSVFVNASTWALMLTGRLLGETRAEDWKGTLATLAGRAGEPVVREAVRAAMRIMGHQFVFAPTVAEALEKAEPAENAGWRHSFDMLGEAAVTAKDAEHYHDAYATAIQAIAVKGERKGPVVSPGISVKLSALHPRFEATRSKRIMAELAPRVLDLARLAAKADIGFCIDAEEAERLDITLDVLEAVSMDKSLKDWEGLGIAVQAYQKRGPAQIDWLEEMATRHRRRLQVRLVKGAYWDAEIKKAQAGGFSGYPVFTRKAASDVCYVACTRKILAAGRRFFPAFASHNALTVAMVAELAGDGADIEFQRLHGMGEDLFDLVSGPGGTGIPCRIYAPVGNHKDLLPYLVRRLLENGSNASFVNRITDAEAPIDRLVADPAAKLAAAEPKPHPRIPLPENLFGDERPNSRGLDLMDPRERDPLLSAITEAVAEPRSAGPIIGGETVLKGPVREVSSPQNRTRLIGACFEADAAAVDRAYALASAARERWDALGAEGRARILETAGGLYEENRDELMALTVYEAGKSLMDAVAEVREAVDFLYYYAARARIDFTGAQRLPGPTGEHDEIRLVPRGTFACISPWNFPLAIFTGQVSAALAAGNSVLAKPAGPTPLIAYRAVQLLHQAGVPGDVLHLLPGPGGVIGRAMIGQPGLSGIAFTGSVETAHLINRALAARDGAIVPLVAETGGQNALIADSSALLPQVVRDALASAFQSAGQRCSALRVLFVQEDVADKLLGLLAGGMQELIVGDPADPETDVGPLIDLAAREAMRTHAKRMENEGRLIAATPLDAALSERGSFFTPHAFEIDNIGILTGEVFGPILHVIRYRADELDRVIDAINGTGFGLTLSVHSRIDSTIARVRRRARVGNLYVNRNQIGAVVGVQPFGGEGLSGTGPKAGGPRYLHRFATERTVSTDTTASGGNASLMMLGEGDGACPGSSG